MHISDVTWSTLFTTEDMKKLLQVNQPIKVKVLSIDDKEQELRVGMKQLTPDL
jgi:ribosomal protein S1